MEPHVITEALPHYQPAYLANGLVGLRVPPLPLSGGAAFVNGFVGLSPERGSEEYADAPYPVGADIQLGGVWLSERPDMATFKEQRYDFTCGELTSRFDLCAGGATASVEVLTFCSRSKPALVLQEIHVEVDAPCALALQAHLDPRGLMGSMYHRTMPARGSDAILGWTARAGLSRLGAAYVSGFEGVDDVARRRNDFGHEEDMQLTQYRLNAVPGKRYRLWQIGGLVPELLHREPHWHAHRMVEMGVWLGFDAVREQNRDAWAELWKGRIRIDADDPKWQRIADAAYFYLHSSVHPSTPASIAPFGLSRRKEYSGHVFWDTETFMFPPVLLTAPDAARAILDYRAQRLEAARQNAAVYGYRGAQFPWQSGNDGCEVSAFYCNAAGEQHINQDIAFAFSQYVHATGDDLFFRQKAWPVLEGIAGWIVSRTTKTARGYEIRHITGPDEGYDNVHNNSYTNLTSVVVLREAAAFARHLGLTPPASWEEVANHMVVPVDPETKVILKHDGYVYESGACCPETMGVFFPFGYSHGPESDAATTRYHLDLADTYLGMPMFSSLYGVWAARAGERGLSRDFFEKGIESHLVDPFVQFNETSKLFIDKEHAMGRKAGFGNSTTTVFLTNPAGFLMSCLYGLPGLQLGPEAPEAWLRHPVALPEGWRGIEVGRIFARGRPASLTAREGEAKARLAWLA